MSGPIYELISTKDGARTPPFLQPGWNNGQWNIAIKVSATGAGLMPKSPRRPCESVRYRSRTSVVLQAQA
jgi:hypothetical protein